MKKISLKRDNGWRGANPLNWFNTDTEKNKCGICGKKGGVLKIFHSCNSGKHKAACYKCSQKLSDIWFGCGCGG